MRLSISLLLASISYAAAQSSSPIAVVGLSSGIDVNTGARPARLNIDDLQGQGGAAWDLYIQALASFQAVNETDELSYFQVLGIHGLPFASWNGVGQVSGAPSIGYCTHNEILFGTWHRPFLALYEQALNQHVLHIAAQYTGDTAQTYQDAAQTLRIPYWDWAAAPDMPAITMAPNVTVNGPSGPTTVRNPLYSYRFQRWPFTDPNFGGTLATYPETVRSPDASGNSQFDVSDASLIKDSDYLKDSVYNTFTQSTTFDVMVTDRSGGWNFENPHNTIHNDVGGSNPEGHMTDLGWSGFDPIFILHHANVDRLIAMWQAIWYNSTMFTGSYSSYHGTFGTAANAVLTADSPLKPFFDADLNLHTSRTVASIRTFGYTYPELPDWSMAPADLSRSVTSAVNQLYSSADDDGATAAAATMRRQQLSRRRRAGPGFEAGLSRREYAVEISLERSELQLPCSVDIYIGPKLAGSMAVLAMPAAGVSYGMVPLRAPLAECKLSRRDVPTVVLPFLQQNLHVEIKKGDGTLIPTDSVPSLQVALQDVDVAPRADDCEFPKYGKTTKRPISLHP